MPLIPWKPFRDLDNFFEDWELPEHFLSAVPAVKAPRMDIYEEKGNIVAEAELPGVDPKNIDVEVKDNLLKVETKTEETKEEKEKGYYKKEMSKGYYKRIVSLPAEVMGEKAAATYDKGVLRIVIPKAKPKPGKEKGVKVKVRSGNKSK
ncbi:MAG TPA: Hsp20/alpha crystallin family protein [Candidatus Parcubacteria bacterium]|nr:Hsp20/alpha crystallin family protein [Candidatus Parcubacteria bacterium]